MWYQGQRVRCTNDHFSGAVWEWTSTLPKSGGIYTIAALNRLPQWNTRTPILCFLLREMERVPDHAFFSRTGGLNLRTTPPRGPMKPPSTSCRITALESRGRPNPSS